MELLRLAFADVADWCEGHLQAQRGREFVTTFAALIRVYGELATLPAQLSDDERAAKVRQLNAQAEELLTKLSKPEPKYDFQYDSERRHVPLRMERLNMIYDNSRRLK